jgi:tetratricopeptide (TPR) repeat protein
LKPSLALPLFLLLFALPGCEGPAGNVQADLRAGEQAYRARDYGQAIGRTSAVVRAGRAGPELTRALYVRGMALALVGRRAEAYADLQRAVREGQDPELRWQAHGALGVLYFEDEQWGAAARVFQDAIDRMPAAPPLDAYLWRLGLCHERQGRWSTATSTFARLQERFPQGSYAEQAGRRLRLRPTAYSIQCGVFAQRANAERLTNELRQKGLAVAVRPEPRPDGEYSAVLEGSYGTYDEAAQALARVRSVIPEAVLWP